MGLMLSNEISHENEVIWKGKTYGFWIILGCFLDFVTKMKSFGKEKHKVFGSVLDVFEFRSENEVIWKGKTYGFGSNFTFF